MNESLCTRKDPCVGIGLFVSLVACCLASCGLVGCRTGLTQEHAAAAAQGTVEGLVRGVSERQEPLFQHLRESLDSDRPLENIVAEATRGMIRGTREALMETEGENPWVDELRNVADVLQQRLEKTLGQLRASLAGLSEDVTRAIEASTVRLAENAIPAWGRAFRETSQKDLEPSLERLTARATKGVLDTLASSLEGRLNEATRTYVTQSITPSLRELNQSLAPDLAQMAEQVSRATARGMIEEFEAFLERQKSDMTVAGDLTRQAVSQSVVGFREGMETTYPRLHEAMLKLPDDVSNTQGGIARFLSATGIAVGVVALLIIVALIYYIRKSHKTSEVLTALVKQIDTKGQDDLRRSVDESAKKQGLEKWLRKLRGD